VSYDPEPCYAVSGGAVEVGYEALVAECACRAGRVVALDGPAALPWEDVVSGLAAAFRDASVRLELLDVRRHYPGWPEVERRTRAAELPGDPVFARLFRGSLAELVDELPTPPRTEGGVTLVAGPGASLVEHDLLWYADLPKPACLERIQRGEAANVGQAPGERGTEKRLLFVDWPLLDRHKRSLAHGLDRLVDVTDPARPRSLGGDALRATLEGLSRRPFRTRPTFLAGAWGGQWLRRELGISTDEPNLAWSYELVTPESSILLGKDERVAVDFEFLLAEQGERVLGDAVAARFGGSFPIRFDYLDTLEGGHLSLQCHPGEKYARETFGLDYTQHETYYVMTTEQGGSVFLGLVEGADLDAFRREAERAEDPGVAFSPERYVQRHPAEAHRLYLIPAGTPHASGAGNVVLEISATPYLYTLRFYDWLRRDLDRELRPVHVRHAFANLDPARSGAAVAELIPQPRELRAGDGWRELELGRHPDLFFAVHRLDFADTIEDDTKGRFHVLNLVDGARVEVETEAGDVHLLSYAETIVVPAAVGRYGVRRVEGEGCKLVKAFVP
jgi:mannose-6-phosphate isomerase class I